MSNPYLIDIRTAYEQAFEAVASRRAYRVPAILEFIDDAIIEIENEITDLEQSRYGSWATSKRLAKFRSQLSAAHHYRRTVDTLRKAARCG